LLSGLPPADENHKLIVVETLNSNSKWTELIVALYSGPTREEKKAFLIPVVPEKAR